MWRSSLNDPGQLLVDAEVYLGGGVGLSVSEGALAGTPSVYTLGVLRIRIEVQKNPEAF